MIKFSFIKDKVKLNKKRTLLRQICLLVSITVLFIFAVLAWFTSGSEILDAGTLEMNVSAGENLEISLDGGATFVNTINLLGDDDQQYIGESNKIKGLLSMEDVTSDGYYFYRPTFLTNATDNTRIPNTDENWEFAVKNRAYISQEIVFRTSMPAKIFMGPGTQIITNSEIEGAPLVSEDASELINKSGAGNFSADGIVGSLRISAVDGKNVRFIYIPRTDVELVHDDSTFYLLTGDEVSEEVYRHSYYSTNYQNEKAPVYADDSIVITDFEGAGNIHIATTMYNAEDQCYYATATVNLWVEGCDAEARRALSGGKFTISLDFAAEETEEVIVTSPEIEEPLD